MDLNSRATYRGQVTRLAKAASEYLIDPDSQLNTENLPNADAVEEELVVHIQRLSAASDSLNKINEQLRADSTTSIKSEDTDKIAEYEDLAISVLARLQSRLSKLKLKCGSVQRVENNVPIQRYSTNLPKLQLKTFSGDFKDWLPFWEQFRSTIHENASLSRAEKFQYLQSVVSGNARKAIAGFTQSEDCYDGAIALLTEEFGNTEKLVDRHMQQLMTLPSIRTKGDVKGLRDLYTNVIACSRSLTSLGVPSIHYYIMLKSVLLRCLPTELRIEYHRLPQLMEMKDEENLDAQESKSTISFDGDVQVKHILQFIKREVESLEKASIETNGHSSQKQNQRSTTTAAGLIASNNENTDTCFFCKSRAHTTTECNEFTLDERKQKLFKDGRCYRCTRKGHRSQKCRVAGVSCKNCSGRHPTTMCNPNYIQRKPTNAKNSENVEPVLNLCTSFAKNKFSTVFLQTAYIIVSKVACDNGLFARIIIDSGSHYSYVTEAIAQKLDLAVEKTEKFSVVGFGNKQSTFKNMKVVKLRLRSQFDNKCIIIRALVVPEICADVLVAPNIEHPKLKHFNLADTNAYNLQSVHGIGVLLGSDVYWQVVTGKFERLSNKLTALETIFGWVLQGPSLDNELHINSNNISASLSAFCSDHKFEFWRLDLLGIQNEEKYPDILNTDSWKDLIRKRGDRYEVSLPWKNKKNLQLDNYRNGAIQRLKALTKKLLREPDRFLQYDKAMREFISAGFAEKISEEIPCQNAYYLPHRPVYREDKATTKLRIVFDASAHMDSKLSLNDCLHTGDNLLPDLLVVVLNFRFGGIGLVADIEKAFLQINLAEEDRDSHRFFWYSKINHLENIPSSYECYRMTRVTFGITSSPFHLCATLRIHFNTNNEQYPLTCSVLRQYLYMDDLICSVYEVNDAQTIYSESKDILKEASMNLRQWNSNNRVIRSNFETNDAPNMQKILGIKWYVLTDEISICVDRIEQLLSTQFDATKRNLLYLMSRIYDPLGICGPVTIKLKILFKTLWKSGMSWDSLMTGEQLLDFKDCCENVLLLRNIFQPRCVHADQNHQVLELHIFADASPQAFGTAAYVKVIDNDGNVSVKLLCAKNRVSPMKEDGEIELTVARLELTAALISARLCTYLIKNMKVKFTKFYLWSDSLITLYWIKNDTKKWKPYVDNRVKEIRRITNVENWRHCPGKTNPADLLTRGISTKRLLKCNSWINGPEWLQSPLENDNAEIHNEINLSFVLTLLAQTEDWRANSSTVTCPIQHTKFSKWRRLLRVTGWIFKFIKSFRRYQGKGSPYLVAEDIEHAEDFWIRFAQNESYNAEIECLKRNKPIEAASKIFQLCPVLDKNGYLRLKGRLQFFEEDEETIEPIILPKESHIAKLLVFDIHERNFHCGVSHVLSQLRERFWIPKGRQLVKSLVKSCIICKKLFGDPATQPFAPLPKERMTMSNPFESVGVDFAGPLYVREKSSDQTNKCYIMIFTCAVIRAVHLELVQSMSAIDCLLALRRFIARRGRPTNIFSDNAKAFKKSKDELLQFKKILRSDEFTGFLGLHKIKWRFIVERAPWWGGFWERLIRSVKNLLKAVIGKTKIDFNELQTILTESECIINSRPITYVSSDPLELSPLTPAHFLLNYKNFELSSVDPAESNNVKAADIQTNWKSRLEIISKLWKRWKNEYLLLLRSLHHVKRESSKEVTKGEVVLIHDQIKPRLLWKLAVIDEIYTGRDGRVRAAQVRLGDGSLLRRPVQLLYPLEIS